MADIITKKKRVVIAKNSVQECNKAHSSLELESIQPEERMKRLLAFEGIELSNEEQEIVDRYIVGQLTLEETQEALMALPLE